MASPETISRFRCRIPSLPVTRLFWRSAIRAEIIYKPSITDNLGNTWPSLAACTANDVGNMTAAIYVLPNSKAGTLATPGIVTVGLGASVQPFQYTLSEFNNIATSSPVNGCIQAPGVSPTSGTISPGSFTPTANNNANGGNIIWSYTASAGNTSRLSDWFYGGKRLHVARRKQHRLVRVYFDGLTMANPTYAGRGHAFDRRSG